MAVVLELTLLAVTGQACGSSSQPLFFSSLPQANRVSSVPTYHEDEEYFSVHSAALEQLINEQPVSGKQLINQIR